MRGLLITFEGTEGAGKSTLIRKVALELKRRGKAVTVTREPGGTAVSEKIRAILLKHPMNPRTELFLYEAARIEHLATTVEPALDRGEVVLCDRFTDSTLAYQAHARGLPWIEVARLNQLATRGLSPNLTILLDIDPAVGLRRARVTTRFEAEGVAFQRKVRNGFLKALRLEPSRWLRLNAGKSSPDELTSAVIKNLETRRLIPTASEVGNGRGTRVARARSAKPRAARRKKR